MKIDSITNGIVIDHITAGCGMKLFELLGLGEIDAPVAFIKNAVSVRKGKKDIIKIDGNMPVNLDAIGYVDPTATINIIKEGKLIEKHVIGTPKQLKNVIHCKNPRCITQTEQELDHVFYLADEETKTYRCLYCETKAK